MVSLLDISATWQLKNLKRVIFVNRILISIILLPVTFKFGQWYISQYPTCFHSLCGLWKDTITRNKTFYDTELGKAAKHETCSKDIYLLFRLHELIDWLLKYLTIQFMPDNWKEEKKGFMLHAWFPGLVIFLGF